MLYLTKDTPIRLAIAPVDFRKQIDGLAAFCRNKLLQDPSSGALFVFINKRQTMIRILCYDKNGFWLATKRLSRGRYKTWPKDLRQACHPAMAAQLTSILRNMVAS